MINPEALYKYFSKVGVNFYTGVPDSLLKEFCSVVNLKTPKENHIISANEGSAIAIASGYHLATNEVPLVYMQNSGIGNAINPILSLADSSVYSIPIILVIGWRGEPGIDDEPQHIMQGQVTQGLLDLMKIPFQVLDSKTKNVEIIIENIYQDAKKNNRPVALLVKKNTFKKIENHSPSIEVPLSKINRYEAIETIIKNLPKNILIVSSTGFISRELYEIRKKLDCNLNLDFLTVGSMGHASQIALGLALRANRENIVCIDGDGSFLMHMGGAAIIGALAPKNFLHIVINNGAHESVGAQATVCLEVSLTEIAKACKYKNVYGPLFDLESIAYLIKNIKLEQGTSFLEIRVRLGVSDNLGRPKELPIENKKLFMKSINTKK